jgi:uncharacterized repeat protein (TIGR01451 family)
MLLLGRLRPQNAPGASHSRVRSGMAVFFAACALTGTVVGTALAFWTGVGEPVEGTGAAVAASVNQGDTPTVSAEGGSSVLVDWSATTMSDGDPVDGYLVTRYDAGTGVAQTTLAGCAGTITATSCTESSIPVGSWKYAVTPLVGSNWRGAESAKSASITTSTIDFLQPVTSPEFGRSGPAGADVGDIDNDGDPDIVTSAIFESSSSVLINNGVGDFRENTVLTNAATIDAGLGKFDNDSNPDLVMLYQGTLPGTGLLIIFKGGGDGTFSFVFGTNETVNTGVRPTKLAVGNFNGDAIDDVAVVNSQNTPSTQAGTVMTFLGNPAGTDTFASATPAQTLSAQLTAYDIAFADFNGGAGDLVVTNHASNSITFLAGNGTGFAAPAHIAVGAPVYLMDTANLNAGTNRDIVASIWESNPSTVRTMLGDGAGGFPTKATYTAAGAGTGAFPQAVVANDLDNDGDQDVAIANGDPKSVSVLDNHGNGAFSQVPTSPETDNMGSAGTLPFEIVSADFDGSGFNDLALNNVFTAPGETRSLLNQSGNKADLSITQTDSPDPVNAGASLTYTLTVANAGPSTPTSVKASDTLPAGVSFNAAASSPSCSAAGTTTVTVTCNYGSVAPGTPESQQVVVTVGWTTPASIANTATVAGNLADPTPANNTSSASTTVNRDTTPPTHALGLNSAAGAFLNGGGTTLYYKGNAAGSFKLVDALSDAWSGPASVTYPAIATTGWTHGAETVTTPSGGPYTSTTFSWTPSPANPTGYSVSGADNANNTSNAGLTFVNDTTAPAGGNIGYTNGMVYDTSVTVTTANGTDGQSGVNASSGTIKRAQATLNTSTQTCGAFGGFTTTVTLVGGNDTSVVSGNCYQYQYLVSDNVGNQATYSSASVAKVDTTPYPTVVLANSGLVNYWRLGESTIITSDSFTGSAGTLLQSHTGEIGATWAHFGTSTGDAVITNANALRRNSAGATQYSASGTPPSADYSVQADIIVKSLPSLLESDGVAVLGRIGSGDNFYFARWLDTGLLGGPRWEIGKTVAGTSTVLGTVSQSLTVGQTYSLNLTMVGNALSLWVDGAQLTSATDAAFGAAGKAGLGPGISGAGASTNTTGLHVDNFRATPTADDGKGTNDGTYWNGPTLGVGGAISDDSNTAVQLDGIDDEVTVARQIQDDFSIELWFKSTQGLNTNSQWWGNAGLVDGDVSGTANDFGVSLRSDGKVVAGTGNPDASIVSSSGGYNDGGWHHVVFTRAKASGALALYVDGAPAGTATGNTLSLTAPPTLHFGRIATGTLKYAGTLDEIALYNSVLSQATISDHYARR